MTITAPLPFLIKYTYGKDGLIMAYSVNIETDLVFTGLKQCLHCKLKYKISLFWEEQLYFRRCQYNAMTQTDFLEGLFLAQVLIMPN